MKKDSRQKSSATQIIEVRRGLYALRYVSALAGKPAPTINIASHSDAEIEIIGMPGAKYATLARPSELLVIRAFGPAQVRLQVTPAQEGGSIVADVRLEDLQSIGVTDSGSVEILREAKVSAPDPIIEILGHLSRQGDVAVGAQEWMAGPSRPATIEGVRISWLNKPANVNLSIEGLLGGRAYGAAAPTCSDGLIGSRGRAIPLVGLKLHLSGTGAARYNLLVESLFRGGQPSESRGQSIVVSGPTGSEALIGLKIDIRASSEGLEMDKIVTSGQVPDGQLSATHSQARVRVFKRSS